MGFVVVLALALLQALTINVPAHRTHGWQGALRAPHVRAVVAAPRDAHAVAESPGRLYHALRVARGITRATLDRPVGGGSPGGRFRAPAPFTVALLVPAPNGLRGAPQFRTAAHVIAARGSLLPYYPTAPPTSG